MICWLYWSDSKESRQTEEKQSMAKISASKRVSITPPRPMAVTRPDLSRPTTATPRASRSLPTIKKHNSAINKATSIQANDSVSRTVFNYRKIGTIQKKSPSISYLRQKAVRQAWKQEMQLVQQTGKGSKNWTSRQLSQLTKREKIKRYEGHHIRDVSTHSKKWAGDPRNITFLTRKQHLKEHRGNFKEPTTGKLIDREKMMRQNRINPSKSQE